MTALAILIGRRWWKRRRRWRQDAENMRVAPQLGGANIHVRHGC